MNIKLIDDYIKNNNLTKKAFCEKCGISLYTLNNLYKNKSTRVSKIIKVIIVLGCSAKDFFGC